MLEAPLAMEVLVPLLKTEVLVKLLATLLPDSLGDRPGPMNSAAATTKMATRRAVTPTELSVLLSPWLLWLMSRNFPRCGRRRRAREGP